MSNLLILFVSCGFESGSNKVVEKNSKNNINDEKCQDLISAAEIQDDSEEYQSSANTYSRSLRLGCGQKYGNQIFQWMATAYVELDKLDSARWAINKGLKILPNNRGIIGVAAKIAKKNNDTDNQLFYLKKKYNLDVSIEYKIGEVCHRYSHFGISMSSFDCKIKNRSKLMVNQPYRWIKKHEINQFAFPKANHKIFSSMLEN